VSEYMTSSAKSHGTRTYEDDEVCEEQGIFHETSAAIHFRAVSHSFLSARLSVNRRINEKNVN